MNKTEYTLGKPFFYILHSQHPYFLAVVIPISAAENIEIPEAWSAKVHGNLYRIQIAQKYEPDSDKPINGKRLVSFAVRTIADTL